ncbi:hypothetical protein OROMI_023836 [Orobanche minor]
MPVLDSVFGSPGTRPLSAPVRPPTLDFDFLRGSSRWGRRQPPKFKFLLKVGGILLLIAVFDKGTDFLSARYAEIKLHELDESKGEAKEKEESPEEMYSRMSNTLNDAVEKTKKSIVQRN